MTTTTREFRLRRLAKKHGYRVQKSRTRESHLDDLGDYMVIDADCNAVVLGSRFDASLDDVERFLAA